MYYVQNIKENRFDPLASWWKTGDRGYTSDLSEARQFTETEIASMYSIEKGDKRAWPVTYIDDFGSNELQEHELDIKEAWKKDSN